jgi:ATP-dependent RNA helicase DDX24/MAK5
MTLTKCCLISTQRGIGESAIGTSLSLVASAEDKQHKIILSELGKELFKPVSLDGRLLADAQERVNLASKIVSCDEVESKSKSSNKWFQEAAAEAGLEVDEDMLDEGLAGGDLREQQRLREAEKARSVLKMLLAQPLVAQRFGKFLSRNSSAGEAGVAGHVVPIVANKKGKKKRHSGHERGSKGTLFRLK